MTKNAIDNFCKKASREELITTWSSLDGNERREIFMEEFSHGEKLREGVTCSTSTVLHVQSEKHRIMKVFGDLFGYKAHEEINDHSHSLYGLRKKNHWDYDRRNFDVYECDVEMNSEVIECRIVISHYLLPVPDKDLGKGLDPVGVIEHDFTARLINFDPQKRPYNMPLYVGDIFDFSERMLKRAFAKYRKAKVLAAAEKFGF